MHWVQTFCVVHCLRTTTSHYTIDQFQLLRRVLWRQLTTAVAERSARHVSRRWSAISACPVKVTLMPLRMNKRVLKTDAQMFWLIACLYIHTYTVSRLGFPCIKNVSLLLNDVKMCCSTSSEIGIYSLDDPFLDRNIKIQNTSGFFNDSEINSQPNICF